MHPSQIPHHWRSLLNIVSRVGSGAVIAGGALRDLDNGRPIKDLDIFVEGRGVDALLRLQRNLTERGFECEPFNPDRLYPVGDGSSVVGIIQFTIPDVVLPIQVIMLDTAGCVESEDQTLVDRVMARMDYGICQLVFDGEQVFEGRDYAADRERQVFALRDNRQGQELASSVHRYARLERKYPGWKWEPYVDPWRTEAWSF